MKTRIRWGVIAPGGIARRRTVPEGILAARNARLVAVWSRSPKTTVEAAKQFGAHAAATLDELLAMELDAVYIASPNHAHLGQTLKAAAAGIHVFCEKPLGLNVGEAQRMVEACRRAKVQLGTAFMMRYHSQHQAALRLVREGRLGKPVFARAQLAFWYPPLRGAWRQVRKLGGGGILMDVAGHCLDLLEMFFGPVASVSCMTNHTVQRFETEDNGVVLARFKNGALATVDTSFSIPDDCSQNRLELYGSRGSILAQNTIGQGDRGEMVALLEGADQRYNARQSKQPGGGIIIAPKPVNTYRAEIEAFSQALLDGRSTRDSAELGLRSQMLLAACYEAARRRKEVLVSA